MELSKSEKALYAELVVQIAIRMGGVVFDRKPTEADLARKNHFDIKGRVIEHGFVSDFEAGCAVLKQLGALQPLNSDETPQEDANALTVYYRMKLDVPELREHLSGAFPNFVPPMREVIEVFLRLTTHYDNRVSTRRDAFPVPPDFSRAFELFRQCGYIIRLDDAVKWTGKIAPAMRAIYAWTEDNMSREELYDAEIEEMWRTLPPRIREVFFSGGRVDVVSLSAVISQLWDGGEWQDTDQYDGDKEIIMSGGAVGKAKDLARKFQESGN